MSLSSYPLYFWPNSLAHLHFWYMVLYFQSRASFKKLSRSNEIGPISQLVYPLVRDFKLLNFLLKKFIAKRNSLFCPCKWGLKFAQYWYLKIWGRGRLWRPGPGKLHLYFLSPEKLAQLFLGVYALFRSQSAKTSVKHSTRRMPKSRYSYVRIFSIEKSRPRLKGRCW